MKKKRSQPSTKNSQLKGASKAFVQSAAHLFLGEKLAPYTPSRIVAAQAMGLIFPHIGKEGLAQMNKTGLYPGELRDMIILLWLCRLEKDGQVQDALLDPIAAYSTAEKWAGNVGLCDMGGEVFKEGLLVFQLIMNEIGDSKTVPTQRSSTGASNDEEEDDPKE